MKKLNNSCIPGDSISANLRLVADVMEQENPRIKFVLLAAICEDGAYSISVAGDDRCHYLEAKGLIFEALTVLEQEDEV